MASNTEPSITLYTSQTPNGIKISILLEELGLPYKVYKINARENEQKSEWFLKINPNGRIPAITDTFTDGKEIRVFESGSIMQYLIERYDKDHKVSFPPGSREAVEVTNWLFFMNAGVGPMQGQANHFARYSGEPSTYAKDRYINETRRLYRVLDTHLADGDKEYLVGNKCTIADIAHWGWITCAGWAYVDIDEFPALKAWEDRMLARPGVEKGRHVPEPHRVKEIIKNEQEAKEMAERGRELILKGMADDAKKPSSTS